MKATVSIKMDNAAFEDNPRELGRILHGAAVTYGDCKGTMSDVLWDSNGNRVGTITITDDN